MTAATIVAKYSLYGSTIRKTSGIANIGALGV